MPRLLQFIRRLRHAGTSTRMAVAADFQWTLVAAVAAVSILVLMRAEPRTGAPPVDDPPGSGVVERTVVTAVWVPSAFLDLARQQAGTSTAHPPEELLLSIERHGLRKSWYALTYRGYQRDGKSAEITQVRLLSDAADHVDELRDVLATVSGGAPRHESPDDTPAVVVVIPDALLGVDPLEAIAQLRAGHAARDGAPHEGGFVKSRPSEETLPTRDASGRLMPIQGKGDITNSK